MGAGNVEAIYSLSPMQEGMLFHTLYDRTSEVYFEQFHCILSGDLRLLAWKRGWEQVIQRHPILRTLFLWKNLEKPLQVVLLRADCPWNERDWRTLSEAEQASQLELFLREDRAQGIDLAQAPVMRMTLIRVGEQRYHFVWSFHHMLLDAWSLPQVIKEVLAYYEGNVRGVELSLERARPYKDYISWLQRQDRVRAELFWRTYLRGYDSPTVIDMPQDQERQRARQAVYGEQETSISPELTADVYAFARQQRLTVNTVMQGAWALLLSRYSRCDDVVFGATVSGYPAEFGAEEVMIGLFITTLPVRVQVQGRLSSWLKDLQIQQAEAREYAHIPLTQLQEWSDLPGHQSLFESLLVFENYLASTSFGENISGIQVENAYTLERTSYPLTLVVMPTPTNLLLKMSYLSSQFDDESVRSMLAHVSLILQEMVTHPDQELAAVSLITAEERSRLQEWNATFSAYPQECFHRLFEQQVERTPDALALLYQDECLTYRALDQRANQFAHALQTLHAGPDMCVGLCVGRSLEMVIGLLAILKAGAAYVPLDPTYPQDRLAFMIEDSGISVLLTLRSQVSSLPETAAVKLCLDAEQPFLTGEAKHTPTSSVTLEDLAYVIYTSGSTGRPKGVQIPHRALTNFLYAMRQDTGITAQDTLLAVTTLSFDISGLEVYLPLLVGASVVIASQEAVSNGLSLASLLLTYRVRIMQATPVTWQLLLADGWQGNAHLIALCGGEALSTALVEQLLPRVHRLFNMYGPTETTIWSTFSQIQSAKCITIGRPLANTHIYILDDNMLPVPLGVPGELYIGGDGLARGYVHLPELTKERFVPHPFNLDRLYRTGDLARFRFDGTIEHLGRLDRQVKIRGYRIEPGEIETALSRHIAIQTCVVTVQRGGGTGDQRLIAYLVYSQEHIPVPADELHDFLAATLPAYMLPSLFISIERIPLTPNGKVDYRSLPDPEQADHVLVEQVIEPSNPIEEILMGTWKEVLAREKIGTHNNFFALGGHSLLAIRLIARINKIFQVDIPLHALFEQPTIASQARLLIEYESAPGRTLKIAQLRKRVAGMSKEEVRMTLQAKERRSPDGGQ